MPAPQISPLPTPPSRSQSPETFSVDADAFLGALPDFQSEANDQADYLDALAIDVTADAAAAEAAAAIAAGAANYQGDYNAGTTYQIGESVSYTGRRYVAKTVNTGITPADGANWFLINDGDVLGPVSATANGIALYDGTTGKIIKNGPAAGTLGNILISDGTTWTSAAPSAGGPSIEAIASGSLANGSTVIINANGTVSIVFAQTESMSATSAIGLGFSSAYFPNANSVASVYDPVSQKVIIVARSDSNSNRPTAVVGTVSGATISFGTPVQIEAVTASSLSIAYHTAANKVVVAYRDNTNAPFPGKAVVGTVSGTSISFGTIVAFKSVIATRPTSMVYDTNAQKIVICYSDTGTLGEAIVGTVSGTSITFGTPALFDNGQAANISACYHTVEQKVVIAYWGVSQFGRAIVGTVSGTTISFGPIYTYASVARDDTRAVYDVANNKVVIITEQSASPYTMSAYVSTVVGSAITFGSPVTVDTQVAFTDAVYDALAQKIVIAYRDEGNLNHGTYRVGTVSGTSITFGAVTVFEANGTQNISLCYDGNAKKVVFSYDSLSGGVARIFSPPIGTNLTTENFIGFSDAAYANGATAKIQIVGSVDDAQSGLTPAQSYFVQNDGSLGLTAGSPSVFAGTAVAANKIIVKG